MRLAPFCAGLPWLSACLLSLSVATAQPPEGGPPQGQPPQGQPPQGGPGGFGPGGFGPGGFGPGGPGGGEQKIKDKFDTDKNGQLDAKERAAARAHLKETASQRRGRGGRGGPGRGFPGAAPADTTPREPTMVKRETVPPAKGDDLYDPDVVRTIFLEFAQSDWFEECADFYRTDVEVPATMWVDGKEYKDVGVQFRGNSSYFGVPGKKKSFGLSVDAVHQDQKLLGYKTLNLLNANDDPSFLREPIHAFIARRYTPALRANLVQLVVNGESWGVYQNVQQFNKDFLADEFGTKKGVRWKVPANPSAGGLTYSGDERSSYERAYQLKSEVDDEAAAWSRLIALCRVLNQTPDDQLEAELPKVLDVDAALRFLAVDTVVLDGDGYSSRGSDFVMWEDPTGRFRPLPYDSNEILAAGGGRRGPGGPGGPGMQGPGAQGPGTPQGNQPPTPQGAPAQGEPDRPRPQGERPPEGTPPAEGAPPQRGGEGRRGEGRGGEPGRGGRGGMMGGASPTSSPLVLAEGRRPLGRLLKVPLWRAQFLAYVRAMATESLDWQVLGKFAQSLHGKIEPIARTDEKALYGFEQFQRSLDNLKRTVELRRKTLLEHTSMQRAWPAISGVNCTPQRDGEHAKVQVTAKISGEGVTTVWLHFAEKRADRFTAVAMLDDGAHGDGAKGDGVFGANTPAFDGKGRVHIYVEARTGGDEPAVAFAPAGGSGRPRTIELAPR